MTKGLSLTTWMQSSLIRAARAHFIFIALYAVYIIASDATGLITAEVVYDRWLVNVLLLVTAASVWYAARFSRENPNYYRTLLYILILADLFIATFSIYTQRGMASRAVILYVIPIIISAILLSRVAIFTTAIFATAAYVLAAVKYFTDRFNEGYKAELYIEVGFYCGIFFIVAILLSHLIKFSKATSKSST